MPTETLPLFTAYTGDPGAPAYMVSFPFEGTKYVVGFDDLNDLMNVLVANCLEGRLIEAIIDFAETSLEWNAAPPVAEAAADFEASFDRFRESAIIVSRAYCEMWKSLFGWSLLANGVLLCLVVWRAGR